MANTAVNKENEWNDESKANNVGSVVSKAETMGKDAVEKGRAGLSSLADNVIPAVKKAYQGVEQKAEDTIESASQNIKKYPFQSLAVGFGVGLIAGFALQGLRKA